MKTILCACGGRLIPESRAPKCAVCGERLWVPVPKGTTVYRSRQDVLVYTVLTAERTGCVDGKRVGYVPNLRKDENGNEVCWNGKACAKRAAKAGKECK